MRVSLILLTLCHITWAFALGSSVQIQHSGVVGREETVDQVLVNGVSLSRSGKVDSIIRSMSADAPLRFAAEVLDEVNQTTVARNHTIIRLRECKLDGPQVHVSDSVLYDGKVYLTLDQTTHTWTAQARTALALKQLWDQEPERTRKEMLQLQGGCLQLMNEFMASESNSGMQMAPVMASVVGLLVFMGLILITLLVSKKQGSWHPGGVIGSVVHYPSDITEMPQGSKRFEYQAL